jgi:hypothetical protein
MTAIFLFKYHYVIKSNCLNILIIKCLFDLLGKSYEYCLETGAQFEPGDAVIFLEKV